MHEPVTSAPLPSGRATPSPLQRPQGSLAHAPDAYPAGRSGQSDRQWEPRPDGTAAEPLGALSFLPPGVRTVLLVAASDTSGDPVLVLRAARALGASADDLAAAERACLLTRPCPDRLAFRNSLIRAAICQEVGVEHQRARRALANALCGDAERLVVAAEAASQTGDHVRATALVDEAEPVADDPLVRARLAAVRGRARFVVGDLPAAHQQLRAAIDAAQATHPRDTLWLLLELAQLTGGSDAGGAAATLDCIRLPADDPLTPIQELARWMTQSDGDLTPSRPALGDTVRASLEFDPGDLRRRLLVLDACLVWSDNLAVRGATSALVEQIRRRGEIGLLPPALVHLGRVQVRAGQHRAARACASEAARIGESIGQREWVTRASCLLAFLAAYEGDEQRCRSHTDTALQSGPTARAVASASRALGLLDLGLGRADHALQRFEGLARGPDGHPLDQLRGVPDLVEAAVRSRQPDRARDALASYQKWAERAQQPSTQALLLRCRALLASDGEAEGLYASAMGTHEPNRPVDLARTALLYGEWLRRARRRTEARVQLRVAMDVFDSLALRPWAQRARGELLAAGEPGTPSPDADPTYGLTAQEHRVVRLAATGMSNRAIAARLFLSHRTVGYHLYKAYPKLGVASRTELARLDHLCGGL